MRTPGPWWAEPEETSNGRGIAICAKDAIVATILPEGDQQADAEDRANALSIVQAVNCHEELLAALSRIISIERTDGRYDKADMAGAIKIAKEAIAKAAA